MLIKIVGFLAAGLVFTTSSVNSLVYSPTAAFEAAAAGFILLSMVAVSTSYTIHGVQILTLRPDHLDILLRLPAAS